MQKVAVCKVKPYKLVWREELKIEVDNRWAKNRKCAKDITDREIEEKDAQHDKDEEMVEKNEVVTNKLEIEGDPIGTKYMQMDRSVSFYRMLYLE